MQAHMPSRRAKQANATTLPEKAIRDLLITCMWRQLRSDVPAPAAVEQEDWAWQHEQDHGIGLLRQRRELLEDALEALNKKAVPLRDVAAVLDEAKAEQMRWEVSRFRFDWSRELADRARTVRREAGHALGSWLRLHDLVNPDRLPVVAQHRAVVQAALDALKIDPTVNPRSITDPASPRHRGRPQRPWLAAARRRLKLLGVPRSRQNDLLRAVGLLELTAEERH
jgi:hypothetical protein